jgi:hypothetical protein
LHLRLRRSSRILTHRPTLRRHVRPRPFRPARSPVVCQRATSEFSR